MAGRVSNSFALMKASANVLRLDKELLVFPLLSGVATVLVTATFIAPIFATGVWAATSGADLSGIERLAEPVATPTDPPPPAGRHGHPRPWEFAPRS